MARDPQEPDVTDTEAEAVTRLRHQLASRWEATIASRPLRVGEERPPGPRLIAIWVVEGDEDDGRTWRREVAVATDGCEVFGRDAGWWLAPGELD